MIIKQVNKQSTATATFFQELQEAATTLMIEVGTPLQKEGDSSISQGTLQESVSPLFSQRGSDIL